MSNVRLRLHHSLDGVSITDRVHPSASWKTNVLDVTPLNPTASYTIHEAREYSSFSGTESLEYYQRYEHDSIPVRDQTGISGSGTDVRPNGSCRCRRSLTNSDIDNLEKKIYRNISQELQTDDFSDISLESNIKFFKTTVEEIFDNFSMYMQDFEVFKKRYKEILSKNRKDALEDMEYFIRDMIHHIASSESNDINESPDGNVPLNHSIKAPADNVSSPSKKQTRKLLESLHSLIEAYNNDNYTTDSAIEDFNYHSLGDSDKEIFNINLLCNGPYIRIKTDNRNLYSEINFKDLKTDDTKFHVASAENLKKIADKKIELNNIKSKQQEIQVPDREIPVKVSSAKKNISLNEDFASREKDENMSFITKLCSYICKKFRRV